MKQKFYKSEVIEKFLDKEAGEMFDFLYEDRLQHQTKARMDNKKVKEEPAKEPMTEREVIAQLTEEIRKQNELILEMNNAICAFTMWRSL